MILSAVSGRTRYQRQVIAAGRVPNRVEWTIPRLIHIIWTGDLGVGRELRAVTLLVRS